jgi:hypothetical protein
MNMHSPQQNIEKRFQDVIHVNHMFDLMSARKSMNSILERKEYVCIYIYMSLCIVTSTYVMFSTCILPRWHVVWRVSKIGLVYLLHFSSCFQPEHISNLSNPIVSLTCFGFSFLNMKILLLLICTVIFYVEYFEIYFCLFRKRTYIKLYKSIIA